MIMTAATFPNSTEVALSSGAGITNAVPSGAPADRFGRVYSPTSLLTVFKALLERVEARLDRSERNARESEVGRYIAENGGMITDQMEREISRRFGGMPGSW